MCYSCILVSVTVPLSAKTLTLFKYREEGILQRFRLVRMVSAKWKTFGQLLNMYENELVAMEMDYRGPGMTSACWYAVMTRWMDEFEATWQKLHGLLRDAKCYKVARDLKRALLLAVNIKPQCHLPAVCPGPPTSTTNLEESENEESEKDTSESSTSCICCSII